MIVHLDKMMWDQLYNSLQPIARYLVRADDIAGVKRIFEFCTPTGQQVLIQDDRKFAAPIDPTPKTNSIWIDSLAARLESIEKSLNERCDIIEKAVIEKINGEIKRVIQELRETL